MIGISRIRTLGSRLGSTAAGKSLFTLVALGAVASVGIAGTQSTLTDQITMAQISVTNGSLDMVANGDTDDTATGWSGSLALALTGLLPGSENSGTVEIENVGDTPYTLTASTAGADTNSCFSYYFRETSVTGGAGAGAWPVDFTGMGTGTGNDNTPVTAAFATAVTNRQLPDAGADVEWEAGDKKVYTLTVRAKSNCSVNAANGTLNFTFDAVQV